MTDEFHDPQAGYHDEQPEEPEFKIEGPIDLSEFIKPKYSDAIKRDAERIKETLDGLRSYKITFGGIFDPSAAFLTPQQRRRQEYVHRMASLKGLEDMLMRFGYLTQSSLWAGLPDSTKISFLLYYANRRACMN